MTYADYCKERCEWCAKGVECDEVYGRPELPVHLYADGSEPSCTAPSSEALIAELSGQIESLTIEVRDERKNAAWEAERAQKAIDERDAAIQRAETAEKFSAAVVLEAAHQRERWGSNQIARNIGTVWVTSLWRESKG